jgi:histidine triad (HIT) family protein
VNETCIFCRIVRGEIPAERVLETDNVIAIRDVNPQAPVHVLVLPKTHVAGMLELPAEDVTWNRLIGTVQEVVRVEGLVNGFRVVVNQGSDGGQTVPHLHLHVLGGRTLQWPPG